MRGECGEIVRKERGRNGGRSEGGVCGGVWGGCEEWQSASVGCELAGKDIRLAQVLDSLPEFVPKVVAAGSILGEELSKVRSGE